jgi:hypothetical protein
LGQMDGIFISIPVFLADRPHMKTAISLPEIVRQTNAFSRKYRPGCSPKMLDSNPRALFLHYNVKCNKSDSDPGGHDVRVQFDVTHVQESQQAKDLDVQVSCSCPAFLYWGAQWNLHQRDGLLGTPRPQLVAPTERLDLRGNYVICKHVYAVFERILPSVQHNIVKLLREREVLRNKQKMKETPQRLKDKQDKMKRKHDLDDVREEDDKVVQQKMLDSLKEEEEARLMHEQQLENQGGAPGDTGTEEAVDQDLPAWLQPRREREDAAHPGNEDVQSLQELTKDEEQKIKDLHKQHKPHTHKGLPYDIKDGLDPDDLKDKEEDDDGGWQGQRVSSKTALRPSDIQPGSKVRFDTNSKSLGTVAEVRPNRRDPQHSIVKVDWEKPVRQTVELPIGRLRLADQMGLLFASASINVPGIGLLEKGMDVIAIVSGKLVRGKIVAIDRDKNNASHSSVHVQQPNGVGVHRADMIRLPQRSLFAGRKK